MSAKTGVAILLSSILGLNSGAWSSPSSGPADHPPLSESTTQALMVAALFLAHPLLAEGPAHSIHSAAGELLRQDALWSSGKSLTEIAAFVTFFAVIGFSRFRNPPKPSVNEQARSNPKATRSTPHLQGRDIPETWDPDVERQRQLESARAAQEGNDEETPDMLRLIPLIFASSIMTGASWNWLGSATAIVRGPYVSSDLSAFANSDPIVLCALAAIAALLLRHPSRRALQNVFSTAA